MPDLRRFVHASGRRLHSVTAYEASIEVIEASHGLDIYTNPTVDSLRGKVFWR